MTALGIGYVVSFPMYLRLAEDYRPMNVHGHAAFYRLLYEKLGLMPRLLIFVGGLWPIALAHIW